ncbi:nuclear receptor-binding protein homolog [Tribolium madens]|uniref:nuclear receptor-binding protein homolog n=1 Tax=Tribolium madens TaxID=41895 RepID=UPI001CF71E54|nr:nuclear receptor-binding protein homolog [Tribolium madens]
MSGSHMNNEQEHKSPRESGEDSEDESEILEESPCGRWLKRREEVEQRDVPGIDCAYLAMDTEEGVEVVWNEVQFSERKNFKNQEEKIQLIFENLTQLEHPNIVKFHRYWTDTHNDKPRVIFITEYMSSGSLKQFLKRTKRNVRRLPLPAWRRWCTQILSALSYLHSCSPPIIHGNLTCDTIFIQHNGLVKIGSVAPDSINHHVKTCQDDFKNMHFIAPEHPSTMGPPMDIYSFGMCALEMAALEIVGNGDSGNKVTEENIKKTIDSLEDEQQKDFIKKCLQKNPNDRPTAKELLFHPLLFEVHSLKLLAAHCLVKRSANISETITDELMQRWYGPDMIVAEIRRKSGPPVHMKMSDIPITEKLEKFVEDVKNGIYPLTAFGAKQPPPARSRAISPEMAESVKSVTPEPMDVENRKIVNMMCDIKPKEESCDLLLTIVLRMDDKMNRHLTSCITQTDSPKALAQELVHYGFINEDDRDKIATLIGETLKDCCSGRSSPSRIFQPLSHMPPPTQPAALVNAALPLATTAVVVNSTPTQVPMHSTS